MKTFRKLSCGYKYMGKKRVSVAETKPGLIVENMITKTLFLLFLWHSQACRQGGSETGWDSLLAVGTYYCDGHAITYQIYYSKYNITVLSNGYRTLKNSWCHYWMQCTADKSLISLQIVQPPLICHCINYSIFSFVVLWFLLTWKDAKKKTTLVLKWIIKKSTEI